MTRRQPIHLFVFLRVSVLPRPKFLFFCANLGHCPDARKQRQIQNFRCPQLSAGEMKFETATPRPGRDRGCRGAKTIHLSFGFLRASVPPWCKGLVFGCGFVAPCLGASVVQRSCLRLYSIPQSPPTMLRHARSRTIFLSALLLLSIPASTQRAAVWDDTPPELTASDPAIRSYLDAADKAIEQGSYPEAFQQLKKALDLSTRKGFLADRAILEAKTGSAYAVQGKLTEAKQEFLRGYADSLRTGNTVLQADVLVALSSFALAAENRTEALDLAARAVETARKSKNLYIQSRALGELGNLQHNLGQDTEARALVEEALQLDRLNHYSWEAAHLLYLGWITAANAARTDESMALIASSRELAIRRENYLVFIQASVSLAQGYLQKKQPAEAVALLTQSRAGLSKAGNPLFRRPAAYQGAAALLFLKIAFLSKMAAAQHAGGNDDEALRTWQELREVAHA